MLILLSAIVSFKRVLLIADKSRLLFCERSRSSSVCFERLVIFKQAILKPRLLGINSLVLERMLLGRAGSGLVEGQEFLRCEIRFLANNLVPCTFK